jgi:hypothetical protein
MQMSTYDDSFRQTRVREDCRFTEALLKLVRQVLLKFKDTNTLNYIYLLRITIIEKLYKLSLNKITNSAGSQLRSVLAACQVLGYYRHTEEPSERQKFSQQHMTELIYAKIYSLTEVFNHSSLKMSLTNF